MENSIRNTVLTWYANICRLLLAVVFVFSGFVKANDPTGFQYKLHDYATAFGLTAWVSESLLLAAAIGMAALEFALGIYLLLGFNRRFASGMSVLLMLFMTPLTLYLALENPVSDCGCFGDAVVLTNWQTFWKNVVLLLAAISVFCLRGRIVRWISRHSEWMVSVYMLLYICIFSYYTLKHLPVFDFRPYHIGADIRAGMEMPEGALPPLYETIFVMERDGEQKEFGIEDYPDESWTLVERKTILKRAGYEPPIHDFSLMSMQDGEDLTERVLADSSYTFLLVAYDLNKADDGYTDLVNEVYDYCRAHQYQFLALTASGEDEVEQWLDRTGGEYLFCGVDETTLKTVVRSNPGMLLLKEGVVVNKWANADIPDEYQLVASLDELPLAKVQVHSVMSKIFTCLLWFLVPLSLILMLDRIWNFSGRKNKHDYINPLKNKKVEMRKNIVAGNWKMNKTLREGIALAKELNEALAADKPNCDVVICTPFIHLASVTPLVDSAVIGVGAENCADKVSGAYTGEVSAEMVASTGAQYVILGHSERRAYYGETVEILEEKVKLALANNLKPIFCIGEVLEEREANKQNEVVAAQLASVFSLSAEDFGKIVLAYEPVWAIGTGKTATPEQAQEIHAYIRSLVAEKYGQEVADNTSILYGGSCKPSNAKELFANPDVDGGLIGGAALKVADFKGIIDAFK